MAIALDPRNLTWDEYCARMAELFAANQLGTIAEKDWRLWADAIAGIGYFTQAGCPDSRGFAKWQDWAAAITGTMTLTKANVI